MKIFSKLFLLICLWTAQTTSQAQVSLYFSGHEDDWELFMGIDAYNDMQALQYNSSDRVAIFHITHGDGYTGTWNMNAREDGAMNSVRFAAGPVSGTPPSQSALSTTLVNGHNISYKTFGNVTVYFFRLPDGCGTIGGCMGYGSLEGLYNGATIPLNSYDSPANSYPG
jgi:hypothetical protein